MTVVYVLVASDFFLFTYFGFKEYISDITNIVLYALSDKEGIQKQNFWSMHRHVYFL